MHPFNSNIKRIRKSSGQTQDQFASKLGIKRCTLGAYEEGRSAPPLEVAKQIIVALAIPKERLYEFFFEEYKN